MAKISREALVEAMQILGFDAENVTRVTITPSSLNVEQVFRFDDLEETKESRPQG